LVNLIGNKKIVAWANNEFGTVSVLEFTNSIRYLYFGSDMEQSAVLMAQPSFLMYTYNRAMLLGAFLHQNPQTALFLGLGGGSLVQAALEFLPLDAALAIEINPHVIDFAYNYLNFRPDLRLSLQQGDAAQLIQNCGKFDLIFSDLYNAKGPSDANFKRDFLAQCFSKLNKNGWLIINQWSDENDVPMAADMLRELFNAKYWELLVPEGNVILFIPQNQNAKINQAELKKITSKLKDALGYSLNSLITKIRPAS